MYNCIEQNVFFLLFSLAHRSVPQSCPPDLTEAVFIFMLKKIDERWTSAITPYVIALIGVARATPSSNVCEQSPAITNNAHCQ